MLHAVTKPRTKLWDRVSHILDEHIRSINIKRDNWSYSLYNVQASERVFINNAVMLAN
jgi:hypothetical protein